MKISKSILIAVALVPVVSISTALAGPKAYMGGASTHLAGIVLKIDRQARTLLVREDNNGRETTVLVPEGRDVPLSRIGNVSGGVSFVSFEHAHIGHHVNFVGTRQ